MMFDTVTGFFCPKAVSTKLHTKGIGDPTVDGTGLGYSSPVLDGITEGLGKLLEPGPPGELVGVVEG